MIVEGNVRDTGSRMEFAVYVNLNLWTLQQELSMQEMDNFKVILLSAMMLQEEEVTVVEF